MRAWERTNITTGKRGTAISFQWWPQPPTLFERREHQRQMEGAHQTLPAMPVRGYLPRGMTSRGDVTIMAVYKEEHLQGTAMSPSVPHRDIMSEMGWILQCGSQPPDVWKHRNTMAGETKFHYTIQGKTELESPCSKGEKIIAF